MKTLILRNIETGKQIKIKENKHYKKKPFIQNAKVGDNVIYVNRNMELEEYSVVKIIDKVKKLKGVIYSEFAKPIITYRLPKGLRISAKNTIKFLDELKDELKKENKNNKELAKLRKRPYFFTRVDIVKGKPNRKENLDRIKFPCLCKFSFFKDREFYGLMYRDGGLFNLLNINRQDDINWVGKRETLKQLIDDFDIEILKGEIQLWKEI